MWENRNDDINGKKVRKKREEKDKEDGKLLQHIAYEEERQNHNLKESSTVKMFAT